MFHFILRDISNEIPCSKQLNIKAKQPVECNNLSATTNDQNETFISNNSSLAKRTA